MITSAAYIYIPTSPYFFLYSHMVSFTLYSPVLFWASCLATSSSRTAKSPLCETGPLSARRHKKAIKETAMERKNIYCTTLAVLFDKSKTEGRKHPFTPTPFFLSLSSIFSSLPSMHFCFSALFCCIAFSSAPFSCDQRKNTNRGCAEPKSKTERKDRRKQEI